MGSLAREPAGGFGATLRYRREAANLTQQELARRAGLSVGTVRSLEQGRTARPTVESAGRLAGALGLDAAEAQRFRRTAGAAGQEAGRNGRPGPLGDQGARASGVWVRVLGPVEVWQRGRPVMLGAAKHRTVLGVLALAANAPVPRDQIIEALWEQDPPASSVNLVQAYVSQLRRVLDPGRSPRDSRGLLQTLGTSYRLLLTAAQLDALAFEELARRGHEESRAGCYAAACEAFEQALALWQGEPLGDVDALRSHPGVTALAHERSAVIAEYARATACLSQPERALPHLRDHVHREPLDEKAHALLMIALADAGQQALAIQVFEDVRGRLDEQLGVRPGHDLGQAQLRVLRQDVRPHPEPGHSAVPRQLPPAVRHFVGRKAGLDLLASLSRQTAVAGGTVMISVISGTAGIGKTALAVQFAHQVAGRFPDGQLYVNLRGFGPAGQPAEPGEAICAFLGALGVPASEIPPGSDAQTAAYRSLLADRRVLVVLDNAHDADQVRPLLPGASGCMVLVTSRNELTSLVAAEGAQPLSPGLFTDEEAHELLDRRLGPQRAGSDAGVRDELIRLCARLPLALSIAAARASAQSAFPLGALAAELREAQARLDLLGTGDAVTDVRAVFSWSYRRLGDPAARMFRLLGIHPGPDVSRHAAASLAGVSPGQAQAALAELTRAQLLSQRQPGRYDFHDLLRAYAAEQAQTEDSGSARQQAMERMLGHYLHTASAAAMRLYTARDPIAPPGPADGVSMAAVSTPAEALAWFQAEHQVLMLVIFQAADLGYDTFAWQIPWAVSDFLLRSGHWRDAIAVQRVALAAARRLGDLAAEGYSERTIGRALLRSGNHLAAEGHLGQAVSVYRDLGDEAGQAHSLLSLGRLCDLEGRPAEALDHAREALALYQSTGHLKGQADCLNAIGWCHVGRDDYREAIACCQQALSLQRELEDQMGEASTLDSLGYAHRHTGDFAVAVRCYRQSLALRRELGDRLSQASTLSDLGDVHDAAGDIRAAGEAWQQALAILEALQHHRAAEVREKLRALPGGPGQVLASAIQHRRRAEWLDDIPLAAVGRAGWSDRGRRVRPFVPWVRRTILSRRQRGILAGGT